MTRFLMIETGQAISAAHSQDLSPTVCVCVVFLTRYEESNGRNIFEVAAWKSTTKERWWVSTQQKVLHLTSTCIKVVCEYKEEYEGDVCMYVRFY